MDDGVLNLLAHQSEVQLLWTFCAGLKGFTTTSKKNDERDPQASRHDQKRLLIRIFLLQ